MKKPVFYSEAAYILGFCLLALGTALLVHGGFGMSMVVAPAYILHLKLSQLWPWFSFGAAEYIMQALILAAVMLVMGRVRLKYFLSILAAVIYGLMLDGATMLVGLIPADSLWVRLGLYGFGVLLSTCAISLLFYSYLPPAAYEMFVKELAQKLGLSVPLLKTVYDCCSLILAVILSLALFGSVQGIGVGTVICALIYGVLIRWFSRLLDRLFQFRDRFELREKFEESEALL